MGVVTTVLPWCNGSACRLMRHGFEFESCTCRNKTPLMEKVTGNHLVNSTSQERLMALSLVSASASARVVWPSG